MDIKEKEAIEKQFERNLDLLIRQKFPLTATAILNAEQPMILLFKELIHRIEKREYEIDKDNNIISDLQNEVTLKQCELDKKDKIINDIAEQLTTPIHSKEWVINHFTNKYEEEKG